MRIFIFINLFFLIPKFSIYTFNFLNSGGDIVNRSEPTSQHRAVCPRPFIIFGKWSGSRTHGLLSWLRIYRRWAR